jgi:hypothetical protein
MKTFISTILLLATSSVLLAVFAFVPLDTPPPKATDIGEIQFERSDTSINNSKYISIPREEFLRFFTDGTFSTEFKTMERIRTMPPDINQNGGQNLCAGHFATKDGRIFAFCRYTKTALEISDSNYKQGWFILEK